MTRTAVVLLGSDRPDTGDAAHLHMCLDDPASVARAAAAAWRDPHVGAVMFWDAALGIAPSCEGLFEQPADLLHAGEALGAGGQPSILAALSPLSMWAASQDADRPCTSWRVSLRAAWVRREAWAQLGGLEPTFETLDAAGLELGYRYMRHGAVVRHQPDLLSSARTRRPAWRIGPADELRFARAGFGSMWSGWGLLRQWVVGAWPRRHLATYLRAWRAASPSLRTGAYASPWLRPAEACAAGAVSVLIPTLDRYPYLRTLLPQLAAQTVPPMEIVLVDQTPRDRRERGWEEAYSTLPLRVIELDEPGQCSSRNAGLRTLSGEFVLFLDDDDEIPPDLIERHLRVLARPHIDGSCGVAHEDGAGPLPSGFRLPRVSDVFPTNNAMLRRSALHGSGLFDLAYDRGQRADWDLGMRLQRAGATLALQPQIQVVHRHASVGGLRAHGARVSTYAGSRRRLFMRNLPTVSDFYRANRYMPARHMTEVYWQGVLGTLRSHQTLLNKAAKVLVGLIQLPDTMFRLASRRRRAVKMRSRFPIIPKLIPDDHCHGESST